MESLGSLIMVLVVAIALAFIAFWLVKKAVGVALSVIWWLIKTIFGLMLAPFKWLFSILLGWMAH